MFRKIAILSLLVVSLTTIVFPQKKEMTVEEMMKNRALYGSSVAGMQWIPGQDRYSFYKFDPQTRKQQVFVHDAATGKEELLFGIDQLIPDGSTEPVTMSAYEWLQDGRHILLTGTLPARTVKTGGDMYLYDTKEKRFVFSKEAENDETNIHASPSGKHVVFVKGNNLYATEVASGSTIQLTFDGSETILNGLFDWVYEEEFSIIQGYQFSSDGKKVAFWRLDQSQVPQISIAKWDSLYLNTHDMYYPKPGAKNSIVKIGIADIATGKVVWADIGAEEDIYIPRIAFTNDGSSLTVQRLNRLQNTLDFLLVDPASGTSKVLFTEHDSAWIDITDNLNFLKDNKHFLWTSDRDGYNHIYRVDLTSGEMKQITKGKWEVAEIVAVDHNKQNIFFTANERGEIYADLYVVSFTGEGLKRLTEEAGYHRITASETGNYFSDSYSNAHTPPTQSIINNEGKKVTVLNTFDQTVFEPYDFTKPEFFTFKTGDGAELNGMMIKPANFDPTKKYPVLFYNYSGPGSKLVNDQFGSIYFFWHQLFAAKGYVVVYIDNRGTEGKGRDFKKIVYRNLGDYEIADHVDAAKYLINQGWADSSRIGIWGWSYGGYVSSLAIHKAPDYFKVAVAVAPVTDWKFYDTIYTERYMSLPKLNPEGYEKGSVMTYADRLRGKFLIIHGTADDNVHLQNSIKLTEKLISLNKPFDMAYYPEKDHGIYGGKTRLHLFTKMTEYILNNL